MRDDANTKHKLDLMAHVDICKIFTDVNDFDPPNTYCFTV